MKRVLAFCTIVLILLCALFSCNTDGEVPDYIGIWFASNVVTPGGNFDAQVTLNEDGTYETLLYNVGGSTLQAGSSRIISLVLNRKNSTTAPHGLLPLGRFHQQHTLLVKTETR
jgi:hypothetical protein